MANHKTIAICESDQKVKWLITQPQYSDKITHWIAANPSAYWELQHHDVFFSTLDEFQKNKSSDDIESLQLEQINWARNVDMFLKEKIVAFKSTNFCPAQNYLFYLKNTWDTLINRADLLENIAKDVGSDTLFYFYNKHPTKYSTDLTISGSALSVCIPPWADHHGITSIPLPDISENISWEQQVKMKNGIRRKITSKLPRFLIHHIQSIINNPSLLNFPSRMLLSEKKGKIIVRNSYDMTGEVNCQLWKNGLNSQSFDIAVARSQKYAGSLLSIDHFLNEAWQQVTDLDWFWQPGGWQKWSLRTGLEPLFRHFWFSSIPELWKSFNGSRIYIQKQLPLAVCVPLIWGPNETGFIMAAHNENIPVIFYQHGASMGDIKNTIWDLVDSFYSDYQLVYGEGAANYIRLRCIHSGSHAVPIPVGSARLDRVGCGMPDKKVLALRCSILGKNDIPLVVYVSGVFFNNYFRYDYQDFRHCRIFDLRRRLAEIINNHPEVHFAYKAFFSIGHDPTLEMLKETCPKCTIINTIPLTELQWAADLIIHEIPSTGMYEGLVTDKPMVVHVDRDVYRMPDEVKTILGKRVRISETNKEFIENVNQFLDSGDFSSLDSPEREFVKAYCTHFDDGQSATRAADAICDITKKNIEKNI